MRLEKQPELVLIRAVLPTADNIVFGFQHVLAMFGGTILGPLLMGFDPNVSLFFSGFGTLLFFALVHWGRVPSYLGSSFSFIAAVNVATGYSGGGANEHLAIALGGIIAAGLVYAAIGLLVIWIGYSWLERLLPPVLTGLVVAIIGVNLASVAVADVSHSRFDTIFGLATILIVSLCNVYLPRRLGRLPILIGGGLSYLLYVLLSNALGLGTLIDFTPVADAHWIDLPHFRSPSFDRHAISLIAPVAIILVAENLGHIRAVSSMVREDLDPFLGRAFFADGLATILSGLGGGTGITTYAENIAVMSMTRVFSARVFVFSGLIALSLSFFAKGRRGDSDNTVADIGRIGLCSVWHDHSVGAAHLA